MLTQTSLNIFNLEDDKINRAFQAVITAVDPVLKTPVLNGVLVSALVIPPSGDLVVSHGLGRPARGYMIVYANGATSVPYVTATKQYNANNALVLTFGTGAGVTVSIWVF